MGCGSEDCAHGAPSRPADGDAADAREGLAQQLWPNGGYRRAHAESCANNLWLSQPERVIRRRSGRQQEDTAPRRRRQSRDRAPGQEIDLRNGVGRELFRLGDDAAGDTRRGAGAGTACDGVNNNRGSAITENGVFVGAESYIRRNGGCMGGSIRRNDQRKVRYIARRHSFMAVAPAAKMRTRGFEVGRLALRDLMNVNGVLDRKSVV